MLREKEREMEKESFPHVLHKHPLSLIPNPAAETDNSWFTWCYGCWRYFLPGDAAYGCSQRCRFDLVLHKECMEMPREIRHPLHPSHSLTLTLQQPLYVATRSCAVCEVSLRYGQLFYKCSGGCEWWIHLRCTGDFDAAVVDDVPTMKHPSHPQHQLRFSKKTISCCDACGASHKGNSYICTICDYWIHESCALLLVSAHFPHHRPDHSLSLAFNPPYEYLRYEFVCAICSGTLPMRRWVYHCQLCRYVVHINCATNTSSLSLSNSSNNENAVDGEKYITKGPIDDIYEEIIRLFVKRERRQIFIPHDHDNQNMDGKYKFNNHHHLLSFTTFSSPSSSSHHHNQEEDDDDDDEDNSIPRSELFTCDGCTLPIHEKKQRDDDEYENGYMSCDECKYFLHLSCFNLPPHLPSLPLHPIQNHNLTLRNAGKLTDWAFCKVCGSYTNGLYYKCTQSGCYFTIDIKCASLPNTIKHAAHPQHDYLNLVWGSHSWYNFCGVCYGMITSKSVFYRCNSCKFCMCGECVLLPAQNKHRLEKHRLWLTYDAYVNRPGEFYCSSCEGQMNPRWSMYHCRDCDQSFHPKCIPGRSGKYRNIKYGMQQYVIPTLHHPHHPLRFQIITKKKRCDLCRRNSYDLPGFQCASCYFVMCMPCREIHMDAFKPI
ncbi:uncharacterized protein LOC130987844 [Salvia miltiorrhiza]|uniref:uncharacterized protein LOC130987844 n=1 Tax=Salvia miltiorrhiza TaxID=226208 RepID=UPI0025AC6873|nr:uncharacterized protein LOC130987844 [Salvia miltiorrhiza]